MAFFSVLDCIQFLKTLGPSAIDLEIRSLAPDLGGSDEIMLKFLSGIEFAMKKRTDFDVVQAYLSLFLKVSSSAIHLFLLSYG